MNAKPVHIFRRSSLSRLGLSLCAMSMMVGASAIATLAKPPSRVVEKRAGATAQTAEERERARLMGAKPIDAVDGEAKAIGSDTNNKPVINSDQPVHDFGDIWTGPVLQHTFILKNEGNAPLDIGRVRPSCGCTVAGPYPKSIAPGETGEFPFSVASEKLNGKFEKAITIYSNDPVNPQYRIRLRGNVKRYVEVMPPNLHFGKVVGDEPMQRVVKLTNNTETPLKVELTTPAPEGYEYNLETIKPGQEYDLKVGINPPYQTGMFRRQVTLKTNVESQPTINIDVRGEVPERLEVNPPTLSVSAARGMAGSTAEGLTRIVRLSNYGDKPVKLLEATADDPAVEVAVLEQSEGKYYSVQVNFPAGYEPPEEGRKIVLKTDDPQKPLIEVPIRSVGSRAKLADKKDTKPERPAEDLVGQAAPVFALTTRDGKSLSTADINGHVTVLNFFAANCGFCKRQIPRIEALRPKYEEKGVRFVAVAQTMRQKFTEDQVVDVLNQTGYKGELALDLDNRVGPMFKAFSYPTMVVLGKSGKVEAVNVGNLTDLEPRLAVQLDALLEGKPIPDKIPSVVEKVADAGAQQQPPPAPAPTPAAPRPTGRPDDLVGKPAPAFEFQTLDGKKVSNADLAAQPVTVLNVVATNCGFCKKQIPRLEELRKKYADKGVRMINVVETMRQKFETEQVVDVMKGIGSHLELAHDPDNKVGPLFNASGFPTMIVLGKSGNVEAVNIGNIGDLETRVSAQFDALIEGKPIPKTAEAPPPQQPQRGRPDDLIGKPAPAFAVDTMDGKKVANVELGNHPATVVNVVAANCGFCKKQIPRLEEIRKKYAEKGVRFVNVVETMRQKFETAQVVDIMKNIGSNLELAHDPDNKVGSALNVSGFPTMFVMGKSGKVEAVNVGNIGDLEDRLSKQLDAVLEGKPIPQAAAAAQPAERKRPAEEMQGQAAPSFSLTTLGGKTVSSDDFGKHPAMVLNFVAPNCGFCKRQIPNIEKIRAEYEAKGVRFVNVSQTMRQEFTPEQAAEVFKGAGSNLELAIDKGNAVGREFKATSYPTMMVVDKSGKVAHVNIGAKPDIEQVLRQQLDKLIGSGS